MTRFKKRLLLTLFAAVGSFVLATLLLALAGLRDDIGKTDVALVLGSKVEPSGKPSARLQARLDETVKLYMAGWFPWVIASGGLGKEGYDEAVVMRDYLAAHGVPQDRILLDSQGNTTFESAQNTLQILREKRLKSVFVISQYFHIPRSRLALKRSGIEEIRSASPGYFELRDLYSAPRELLGYFSYLLRSFDKK
ncbi:YdcF family protein [Prosthecobacter fluviatilis]|uniref:YdcF family protein n=1 Tax=Prosthecobacter fluviatilis TaxID=445931 RepID=A0ABW0KQ04_9BACT